MLDLIAGLMGLLGYVALIAAYLSVRPRGVLSIMDMFVVLFSTQFGPHAVLKHPFLETALFVPEVYPYYAVGLALAYLSLAFSLFLGGTIVKTRSLNFYPFQGADLQSKNVPAVLFVAALYVGFFVALQGFDLSRTISYLKFFSGDSFYTYTELRREKYVDSEALGLTAITRQTTSALIYAVLIYVGIRFREWRLVSFLSALVLFIVCSMQMNKFPFLYYLLVALLIAMMNKNYETGEFVNKKMLFKLFGLLAFLMVLLSFLYRLQYGSEIEDGVVTNDRILFRIITRPFTANHDVLYVWFANFPDRFGFIGFSNVMPLVNIFGLEYFGPTVEIPALYESVETTYQAGYIGSAYASFGYFGVMLFSIFIGGWVAVLTAYEKRLDVRWQRIVFFSVIGMNFYFLVSREFHTALQSGGIVLAPVILMLYRMGRGLILRR